MTGIREKGKARRKRQIIQAAKRLLAAGGIEALSTRKLAEEAEVSVHTLYALVGSKDAILDAVMADNHAQVRDDLLRIGDHAAIDRMFGIVESTYRIIAEDSAAQKPVMRLLMTRLYEGRLNPDPWWLLGQEKGWLEGAVVEAIEQGLLRDDFAPGLIGDLLMKIYLANLRDYLFDQAGLETCRLTTTFEFWLCLANVAVAGQREAYLAAARAAATALPARIMPAGREAPPA